MRTYGHTGTLLIFVLQADLDSYGTIELLRNDDSFDDGWEDFKRSYDKTYSDPSEENFRFLKAQRNVIEAAGRILILAKHSVWVVR